MRVEAREGGGGGGQRRSEIDREERKDKEGAEGREQKLRVQAWREGGEVWRRVRSRGEGE